MRSLRYRGRRLLLGWMGLVVWLAAVEAIAQSPGSTPVFRHLTIDDGLSQNVVAALLQDRHGFVWVGTKDGLNRFDGHALVVHRHDPFDPATLSSSHVTALLEGDDGHLWVGTRDGGLNRLSQITGEMVRYTHSPAGPIAALVDDGNGRLWGATLGGGLFHLRQEDGHDPDAVFERVVNEQAGVDSLRINFVKALLRDDRGTMWAGSSAGLHRYDAATERFDLLTELPVSALAQARDGTVWVGQRVGLRAQLVRVDGGVDPATGRLRVTAFDYPDLPMNPGWEQIDDIAEGPAGHLWLATPVGLGRFDPETGSFTFYHADPTDATSVSAGSLTKLLWDRTGVLWVGSSGYGLSRFDARRARFSRIAEQREGTVRALDQSIRSVFEDQNGTVWIGTNNLSDPAAPRIVVWSDASAQVREVVGYGQVWALTGDPAGALWLGTEEGLVRLDPTTGRFRHYVDANGRHSWRPEASADLAGIEGNRVFDVHRSRSGHLWIVTARYLARLDDEDGDREEAGRFTTYVHTPQRDFSVNPLFPSLHEDVQGRFWLGTETGLVRLDPSTGALRRYRTVPSDPTSLSSERIRWITPDPRTPEQVLWIGTDGGGLNRLDLATETFAHITTRDGLPNNVVYAVLPDEAGRLWLSTNRGLARYDPEAGSVRTFDVHDGLQSNEFNAGAAFRADDGQLFFGGIHGINAFDPEQVTDNPHVPPVVLTELRVGGQPIALGDSTGVLRRALLATDELRLSHRQNAFAFTFAALDYSAPEKNRYAYRLDGFDDGWVQAGTARTATYTNVPPGRYTFRVRGTNNDGVWNEAGTALGVVVVPPWWRTWWAYFLYGLAVAGTVAMVLLYRRERIELRHRSEMERLEAEQLRELDRARSRFFANVSHEFRTPLTLTLGPLDDVRAGHYGTVPDAMDTQLSLARTNAGRVLTLINEILDVSRLEAGQVPLHAQAVNLGAFVSGLAAMIAPLAERRRLTLAVEVPAEPLVVYADPALLEKVAMNLLSNALKFTPEEGHVWVEVTADDTAAAVAVRDDGLGIAPEALARVFDRFYRASEAEPAVGTGLGTGIGLALAKELANLHRGTLTAESTVGQGSTFTLTLRLGHAHLPEGSVDLDAPLVGWDAETPAETPVVSMGDGTSTGGTNTLATVDEISGDGADGRKTVLVVEDHPEVRAFIRRHLERGTPSYRVLEAATGDAGLDKARRLLPDLVLSDVMMPGALDGVALCRALKADPETDFLPVVLLTARATPEDRIGGLEEQADDYLTKPFDPAELRARIANLIAGRQRLRERFLQEGMARVLGEQSDAAFDAATLSPPLPPALQPSTPEVTSADEALLDAVRQTVEARLADEDFGVSDLAEAVGLSRSQLYRRMHALTGHSTSDVIRSIRLERGAQLLAAGVGTVSEIAYAVGFKTVSHFSNAFTAHHGCRPSAYPHAMSLPTPSGRAQPPRSAPPLDDTVS
ncbi:MAG: two-component regulator propeller domain-containing protein [Bacteroidota bacterium]